MVGGPAHGPRVDVVQLAAGARARALVTPAVLKEVLLAMPHLRRDCAVVPLRDEGQPPQNGGDGDNVDDRPSLGSGWYSLFVPLSPASLHQGGVFLRRTQT
jgi:hypothetical protein